MELAQCFRQVGGVTLLQAEGIDAEILGQGHQFPAGLVLTKVVANDSYQWIASPGGAWGAAVPEFSHPA
ncbi:MAG: hypothetical protein NVS2B15_17860 [Pseudarthrobacter sp.]